MSNLFSEQSIKEIKADGKILIIGQAPPVNPQDLPYDSTMLYDWLAEVGISKEQAQEVFIFEAVSNVFPGTNKQGGHKPPTSKAVLEHWPELENKIQLASKVWLVGSVASNVFHKMPHTWSCNLEVIETMHPSRRNYYAYTLKKEQILNSIKSLLKP